MVNNDNIQPVADESQIVLYQPNDSVKLEVKVDAGHETVWLTQQQIADLFGTKRPAITKHLGNIFIQVSQVSPTRPERAEAPISSTP